MMEVLGDAGSVGADDKRVGPSSRRGANSRLGVLEHQTSKRRHAKQLRGIEIPGRVGFSDWHILTGDDDSGYIQPGGGEAAGCEGARRGCHDGYPCPFELLEEPPGTCDLCDPVDSIQFQGMEFRDHRGWIDSAR